MIYPNLGSLYEIQKYEMSYSCLKYRLSIHKNRVGFIFLRFSFGVHTEHLLKLVDFFLVIFLSNSSSRISTSFQSSQRRETWQYHYPRNVVSHIVVTSSTELLRN